MDNSHKNSIENQSENIPEDILRIETDEWLASLDYVIKTGSTERVKRLLRSLQNFAAEFGIQLPYSANTPYLNSIPRHKQVIYPGNLEVEKRIRSLIRWNALAMVVRANRNEDGIGGHISTYASCATLLETGFNHFFRGKDHSCGGDFIYFQGHTAPGIYARAFLEGRLSEENLINFRRELQPTKGLSSYPHPYCMPNFWEFPTVSMGLGPIMAIYQARFNRYLEDRGIIKSSDAKVWCFIGDGESDEPETLGAISLAAREKLDNLIFVINCNLQRLDGPVRGNYKIIQELEANFRGAGWNVLKVIWGGAWDPLLAKDTSGILLERMEEVVDGEYQTLSASTGAYIREHFFGKSKQLASLIDHYSDEDIKKFNRGGHDPEKVYAAYKNAIDCKNAPSVILAKTIKGYGLGDAGEGKNITHQQKKLNEKDLTRFRSRFSIPISDEELSQVPFYKPKADSEEILYLKKRREELGGAVPERRSKAPALQAPDSTFFDEFFQGSAEHELSTTMAIVRILTKLLKDKDLGKHIVPIIPDEARTFGMEALFRQVGIYSHVGQKYEPVDKDSLLYYREVRDGQILEEGITEAGGFSSFIAAGTSYANHNINMIPFFICYSMFGFQRIGDLIWAAGDMGCRGFFIGGTAGRTTLAGEGLQHQDGHSHHLAFPYPHVRAYDPTFAFELAVIIEEGLNEMYVKQKNCIYYITVGNQNYKMLPVPTIAQNSKNPIEPLRPSLELRSQILKGLYKFQTLEVKNGQNAIANLKLLTSGALFYETLKAAENLSNEYNIQVEIWNVTSYKSLYQDLINCDRNNVMNGNTESIPFVTSALLENKTGKNNKETFIVAVSDYTRSLPLSIAKAIPFPFIALGTDGFGRSEARSDLRKHFEVDAAHIAIASLSLLAQKHIISSKEFKTATEKLNIHPEKINPILTHWS